MSTRIRTSAVSIIVACLAATGAAQPARSADPAAGFPGRPVRIVVPFTPGGQPDIFTRLIAPRLTESFRQQVVVDNRPGAGGMIGSRIVADSTPDGYTLLSISSAHTIAPFVRKVPYNTRRDFSGVTISYTAAYLLVVPAAFSARTLSRPWSCSMSLTVKVTSTPPTIEPVTLPEPPRITIVMASNE